MSEIETTSKTSIVVPPSALPVTVRQVLDATRVGSRGPLFVIAPFPRRINFASQQRRAFNLIWALCESGAVTKDSKVAVVGAGLAGITSAAALWRKGVTVKVFEASDEMLKIQRYTTSRYVHPSLNYWPEVELNPTTDFPCLNWCADNCNAVIQTIMSEWEREFASLPIEYNSRVTALHEAENKITIEMEGGRIEGPLDIVVLAVGFGMENPPPSAYIPSYWEDADPRRESSNRKFFVSGIGDGGLLETLRLAYDGFGEGQLTSRVARVANRLVLGPKIKAIDDKASNMTDPVKRSKHLAMMYQTIPLQAELADLLDGRLTGKRSITLLARGAHAYGLESAPLHRLMLARAIQKNCVHVRAKAAINEVGEIVVDEEVLPLNDGLLIIRHGPSGEIQSLLDEGELQKLAEKQRTLSEYQFENLWRQGFFDKEELLPSSHAEQRVFQSRLEAILPSLAKEFPGAGFSVNIRDGKTCYSVRLTQESALNNNEFPPTILGVSLEVMRSTNWIGFATTATTGKATSGERRYLRPGDRLKASPSRYPDGASSLIGGFVSALNDDAVFAVTAGHALDNALNGEVYASDANSDDWQYVGVLSSRIDGKAGDIAFVELASDVGFEVLSDGPFDPIDPIGSIGRVVLRRTSSGNTVRGVITGVALDATIDYAGRKRVIKEGVIVRAEKPGQQFAVPGESGSIVTYEEGEALGLVVAGDGEQILVSPLHPTIDRVGASLLHDGRVGRKLIAGGKDAVESNLLHGEKNPWDTIISAAKVKQYEISKQSLPYSGETRYIYDLPIADWGDLPVDFSFLDRNLFYPKEVEPLESVRRDLSLLESIPILLFNERLDEATGLLGEALTGRKVTRLDSLLKSPLTLSQIWRAELGFLQGLRREGYLNALPPQRRAPSEYHIKRAAKGAPIPIGPAVLMSLHAMDPDDISLIDVIKVLGLYWHPRGLHSARNFRSIGRLPSINLGSQYFEYAQDMGGSSETGEGATAVELLRLMQRLPIEPAIFEISDIEQATRDRHLHKGELQHEIMHRLGRNWLPIFDEMSQGHLVTRKTAETVASFLSTIGRSFGSVIIASGNELMKRRVAFSERFLRRG